MIRRLAVTCLVALVAIGQAAAGETIVVGSKRFTESYVLAEIFAQTLERAGYDVERQFGFGGTLITFEALAAGEIDVYPEYSGTLTRTVLRVADDELDAALATRGLQALAPLGFDNTYALAVTGELAASRALRSISDLAEHGDLALAFSHEFLNREDGWPGLRTAYGLDLAPSGIDHGLAYRALVDGRIDVTDAYATDGDISRYGLTILKDDLEYFPAYLAVPLVRATLPENARARLDALGGRIDDATMRALNARVMVDGATFETVAREFLGAERDGEVSSGTGDDRWSRLWRNTQRHLKLTLIALFGATLAGIGTALAVYRSDGLSRTVLYVTGLMQTIPSIALLALMIPLFGVGQLPAIVALFLYSLLPVVRSTLTAMQTIAPIFRQVADAMGLTNREQLRHVLLPLAMPNLLTGIKTAAIISIGTATLAAFIGAGGLGEPIVTGLALNDVGLILEGAIPAALLAVLTELGFEWLEAALVPAHMRRSLIVGRQ